MTTPPRYLRATVVTTAAASVVPTLLIALGVIDAQQGPPVEASEAQGALIFLVHALVAILFVALAFPIVAWHLYRRTSLTRARFYRVVLYLTIGASVIPAGVLAVVAYGINALVLAPASFVALALLSLPYRPIWLRFA